MRKVQPNRVRRGEGNTRSSGIGTRFSIRIVALAIAVVALAHGAPASEREAPLQRLDETVLPVGRTDGLERAFTTGALAGHVLVRRGGVPMMLKVGDAAARIAVDPASSGAWAERDADGRVTLHLTDARQAGD